MIQYRYKLLSIIFVVVAAFLISSEHTSAKDVLEFIDLPDEGIPQATLDPLLACRDGVMFELHTASTSANTADGPHPWDISFAQEDGNLIIKEHPLWLGRSSAPLVREGVTYPYSGLFTLLWKDALPPNPLSTCIAGAGTGFCKFALPIDDCRINSWLNAEIAQIAPEDTSRRWVESLVFEVKAYDPEVGTGNGDGIAMVEMSVIDRATGTQVLSAQRLTQNTEESGVKYCAFTETCAPWIFSDQDYRWPGGDPIHNGVYLLRAVISTPDDTRIAIQREIEVTVPPTFDTVHVPAGEFTMGSDATNDSEMPAHLVTLDEFWIMKTEVTNQEYAQCVSVGACSRPKDDEHWRDPAYAQHPVASVNWHQANDFAEWAGGRLPTEAEWEKACRGTDGRTFPWGDTLPTSDTANYGNDIMDTVPVGSYPANVSPYGALDMSGNVWEWTSSDFAPYPYQADDGREDSTLGDRRMTRGGSFYYTHYQLTCTFRAPVGANVANPFRLAFDYPFITQNISFAAPADGATVPPEFDVVMVANGLTIEPAGELHENAGHFHLLVDSDFIAPGELIPFDANHIHFGKGELSATIELTPGEHILRLQFADGAHIAQDGEQYRAEITVNVEAPRKSSY